jgi:3-methyladenine DNA glycosylase AlkD
MSFVNVLRRELSAQANLEDAASMQAYMKDKFIFFGVRAPVRQEILKNLIKEYKPQLDRLTLIQIAKDCYAQPQRELHYCGMELITRFLKKKFEKEDIDFITYLITTHSWWDTVDMICKHHLGGYLKLYPKLIPSIIQSYSNSGELWLQRSAILFQLEYKEHTDQELLFALCKKHKDTKEFFMNKSIGWALREYSKTNPQAVIDFVAANELAPLSRKEALRKIR